MFYISFPIDEDAIRREDNTNIVIALENDAKKSKNNIFENN